MKRIVCCTGFLLLISACVQAQSKSRKEKQAVQSKAVSANKKNTTGSSSGQLNSTANYPAKSGANNLNMSKRFVITDPIITTMDARANGANVMFNHSTIVGVPKRAYGFANGHISLKTSGAVTAGTQTGSGAVSTGTSLGTFGSLGPAMEVNGKNPYAGTIMWGTIMGMNLPRTDTISRPVRLRNY